MIRTFLTGILLAFVLASSETVEAQQLVTTMTPETIDEAIRLAGAEKATARFLEAYVVQTRAGWGYGPPIGSFSTPFARVVQAAVAARKRGSPFTPADVTPDLIAPELHVIALAQPAATDEGLAATVLSVTLGRRGSKDLTDAVQPVQTTALTAAYQNLTGTTLKGTGIVAVFPLSALGAGSEIHVVFDRAARGLSRPATCRECTVPMDLSRVR
jgi:hypothetical protein